MYANITTWFISDIARKSENVEEFLRTWQPGGYRHFFEGAAPKIVPVLRNHGMVSSYAIRTRIDMVTIVSVYEDEVGAEEAWMAISGHLHEIMEGALEFVERTHGPVEDLLKLGTFRP